MTYQAYFEKVQKELQEKAEVYMMKEKEFASISGFGDSHNFSEYFKAKSEWQTAWNNYYGFLYFIKDKNIQPTDEFVGHEG